MTIINNPQTAPNSIETLFGLYKKDSIIVNRRYQRKLVWNIEEKQNFVKSLINGYPVPLIIFVRKRKMAELEILDGLQRLNATMSFIEGEFRVLGGYFDLDTISATKGLKDGKALKQKKPTLDLEKCRELVQYQLPTMICEFDEEEDIDKAFRLINSNGRYLSHQELRHAGSVCRFAHVVSKIARDIRGDVSVGDRIPISKTKSISISSKELPYGVLADSVYWVAHGIVDRTGLRRSRDEQLIADMLGYILLEGAVNSSMKTLDSYFDDLHSRFSQIDQAIVAHGEDRVAANFMAVHDSLEKLLKIGKQPFRSLIGATANNPVPRYYQSVFLAIYELMVLEDRRISDWLGAAKSLETAYSQIGVPGGGGDWSIESRKSCVRVAKGLLADFTKGRTKNDPATDSWVTRFRNLLSLSQLETVLFDFKQGLYNVKTKTFESRVVSKAVQTLSAISNAGPGTTGYVLVGVCDSEKDAKAIEKAYKVKSITVLEHFVTGLDHEIALCKKPDHYIRQICETINKEPISDRVKSELVSKLMLVKYEDRHVLILRMDAGATPETYNGAYYQRSGESVVKVEPGSGLDVLYKRFIKMDA